MFDEGDVPARDGWGAGRDDFPDAANDDAMIATTKSIVTSE